MEDHIIEGMSESEEMYLITVAQLIEQGVKEPVPISRLAQELSILPVSTNQMVHKLAEAGWVDYLPYKGVALTTRGRQIAQQVLRHRRLWEVFLTEHLNLSLGEADALACRFEHITPKPVIDQLADFLENPAFSPQGLPIPAAEGDEITVKTLPLTELPVGREGQVMGIEADPQTSVFLESTGIRPGAVVRPLAITSRGSMLLQVAAERLHLTDAVANGVLIRIQTDNNVDLIGE